jgi:hypothetical protein
VDQLITELGCDPWGGVEIWVLLLVHGGCSPSEVRLASAANDVTVRSTPLGRPRVRLG